MSETVVLHSSSSHVFAFVCLRVLAALYRANDIDLSLGCGCCFILVFSYFWGFLCCDLRRRRDNRILTAAIWIGFAVWDVVCVCVCVCRLDYLLRRSGFCVDMNERLYLTTSCLLSGSRCHV
jgi:hypothetical protein